MKKQLLLPLAWLLFSLPLSAQWQHIPGPDGGYVVNLDTDGSQLYALTLTAIYLSDDEGYHWQAMQGSHHASRTIDRLVVENGVFYGKNTDGEVLRSSDGGQTWQAVLKKPYPITAPGEVLHEVFAKGDTVLVSSAFTIYRSVDRGETWGATSDLFGYGHSNVFSAGPELMAWSGRNIHRSSDGGLTWQRVFTVGTDFHAVDYANGYVFGIYSTANRVVRSKDGLRTWKVIDTDSIIVFPYRTQIIGDGETVYYINREYICGADFAYSTDNGLIWHPDDSPNIWDGSIPLTVTHVISFGKHIVLAHKKGISHSVDKLRTFKDGQQGLCATYVNPVLPGEQKLSTESNLLIYVSDKTGEKWEEITIDPNQKKCYNHREVTGTQKRWFLRDWHKHWDRYSDDEGETWKSLPQPLHTFTTTTENCFWDIAPNALWKWCDGKTQFTRIIDEGYTYNNLYGFEHYVMMDTKDYHVMYSEGSQFATYFPFSPCNPNTISGSGQLHFDGHHLFHFCDQNTYVFKENATAWEEIYPQDWTTGIPLYHNRITALATHQGVTWAALEGKGLFYTTDATGRFYPALPQLPYPYPTAISFRDNEIWVGTEGGGIYHTALLPVQVDATGKPQFQCSPNPSDGRLHLQADVFFTKEIPLEVLDVSGKQVAAKTLSPGQAWDLAFPNLPRGMYMLMLRTGAGTVGLKWAVH